MREASYEDPRYGEPTGRGKIACVIPLYIPNGRKKDYGYFVEDKFETLTKTLAAHKHFKPGVAYDVILVDNESPQDFDHFNRICADDPSMRMLRRQNEGYGFGAWKHAYETLKNQYDFFLFIEDDNAPAKDGWLAEILLLFFSDPDVGAVGNYIEAHGHNAVSDEVRELCGQTRESFYNFDGAYTFTSTSILREVDTIGGLPVFPCQPKHKRSATVNELAFQQPILELGYKLLSFSQSDRLIIHGSEIFTGDLSDRGAIAPIVNHNAWRKTPEVAEAFAWYQPKE